MFRRHIVVKSGLSRSFLGCQRVFSQYSLRMRLEILAPPPVEVAFVLVVLEQFLVLLLPLRKILEPHFHTALQYGHGRQKFWYLLYSCSYGRCFLGGPSGHRI